MFVMRDIICPVCGARGSLQLKYIKSTNDKLLSYYYIAHYKQKNGKPHSVEWHYVGKQLPESLAKQIVHA